MEPTLYIVMRSDIPDMNPGKGMAQAAHAQAEFDECMSDLVSKANDKENTWPAILVNYAEWMEGRAFGRTIVLSADLATIREITTTGKVAALTVDPTYPWKNYYGELQVTEEATCGWIFVSDENAQDIKLVENLPLHQ